MAGVILGGREIAASDLGFPVGMSIRRGWSVTRRGGQPWDLSGGTARFVATSLDGSETWLDTTALFHDANGTVGIDFPPSLTADTAWQGRELGRYEVVLENVGGDFEANFGSRVVLVAGLLQVRK